MSALALIALAERCEVAAGPDRELDAEIQVRLFEDPKYRFPRMVLNRKPANWIEACQRFRWDGGGGFRPWPAYTASLDAPMALVPEGYDWAVFRTNGGLTIHAWCGDRNDIFAATPALALTAAALRAIAGQKQ